MEQGSDEVQSLAPAGFTAQFLAMGNRRIPGPGRLARGKVGRGPGPTRDLGSLSYRHTGADHGLCSQDRVASQAGPGAQIRLRDQDGTEADMGPFADPHHVVQAAAGLDRAPVQAAPGSDLDVVAYHGAGGQRSQGADHATATHLAARTQEGSGKDACSRADPGAGFQHGPSVDLAARVHPDLGPEDRAGAHVGIGGYHGRRVDDGGGVHASGSSPGGMEVFQQDGESQAGVADLDHGQARFGSRRCQKRAGKALLGGPDPPEILGKGHGSGLHPVQAAHCMDREGRVSVNFPPD